MPPSKRPENTAFKQQRLKSWQPLLTPKTVIPTFFIIGLIFVPIGVVLQLASDAVKEIKFDYSNCKTASATLAPSSVAGINQWSYDNFTNSCLILFDVPTAMQPPIYIYYRLTNFYQNNRKYVKSFDLAQLGGTAVLAGNLDQNCVPLSTAAGQSVTINGTATPVSPSAVYYPCGLIANSIFSGTLQPHPDSISALTCVSATGVCALNDGSNVGYVWSNTSIAWPADASRYGKSGYLKIYPNDTALALNVVPPPFWRTAFPQYANGYTSANFPDLTTWTGFQVWMRTAGLPTFRKLWGANSDTVLSVGTWSVNISQGFDTAKFGGTKSIVISTASLLGGKNSFLGGAYLLTGLFCFCLGVAFLIRNMVKPRFESC